MRKGIVLFADRQGHQCQIRAPATRGTPRWGAPSGWGLRMLTRPEQPPMLERSLRNWLAQARSSRVQIVLTQGRLKPDLVRVRPRKPAARRSNRLSFAASMFPRATSRWSNLSGTTAGIRMVATRRAKSITFCGHPRRAGSSYCTPHFHLTRDPVVPPERAVSTAPLRLVDADEFSERVMETNPHGTSQT